MSRHLSEAWSGSLIDQDLHNSSETLEEPPAAELDAAQEPASNCRPRRSPVAWIIGIAALALGGTLVFESMPPEGNTPGGRQTQAAQAAPVAARAYHRASLRVISMNFAMQGAAMPR